MEKTTATAAAASGAVPRMSRTRKSLIEAGKRLLANGSMGGASIDDIVREADVAKGSFYNHFPDRETLVETVVTALKSELHHAISVAQQGADDPAALLVRGLLVSFRYGLENQLGARAMLNLTPDAADPSLPLNLKLIQDLQAGIDQKAFKLTSLDSGVVLVLGLSDLGIARLLDLKHEFQQTRAVMRDIGLTLLRALGTDARKAEKMTDEALILVIDAPRKAGLSLLR